MDLVVDEGLSYKQIVARLGIAMQTVKNHFSAVDRTMRGQGIYRRMGCGKLTEAAIAYLGYRSLKARGMLNGRTRERSTG